MRSLRSTVAKQPQVPVLDFAVRLLSAKPYSIKKLRERLLARGYGDEEIAAVIERLKRERLLDDRKFAENFVQSRLASRPRAAFVLIRELVSRGVSSQDARAVVTELVPAGDEERSARELVRQKARAYAALPDPVRVRRLSGLLARRGYSIDVIHRVLAVRTHDSED